MSGNNVDGEKVTTKEKLSAVSSDGEFFSKMLVCQT
jgi:hypothetical protein